MRNLLPLILVSCLLTSVAYPQTPVIRWQKTIGGDAADQLSIMLPTPDGGFIAGGSSTSTTSGEKAEDVRCPNPARCATDYWILKLDDTGAIEWQRTIGCDASDDMKSIGLTSDGGYIVGGTSASDICTDKTGTLRGGTNNDYWILKLDVTGSTQWQKTIGGNRGDRLVHIEQTADGGYIVGGTSQSNTSDDKTEDSWVSGGPLGPIASDDYWILKLDDTGRIEWQKTLGGFAVDDLRSIHQTSDGGYIVGGSSSSGTGGNKTEAIRGNNDYWILKLDATGNIVWQRTIGGNKHDELATIRQTSDGGYIVGGSSMSDDLTGERTEIRLGVGEDYWVLKLDNTGAIQWQRAIRADMANKMADIHETSDGGYIVGGTSTSDISGDKTEDSWNLTNDYWILKLDATGNIQWQKTIGGNGADDLACIREIAPHEYIIGGSSGSAISGNKTDASRGGDSDFWIVKLDFDCAATAWYAADSFCRDESFSYTLPGGASVSVPGIYRDTFVTETGCDSIWVTTLSLIPADTAVTQSGQTLTAVSTGAGYQWINCSDHQSVPGATNRVFTPAASGSYAVVVTSNGCSDTSGCHTVIPATVTGILPAASVHIYPNPAGSVVYIDAPEPVFIIISGMDGKVISTFQNVRQIPVDYLSDGGYLLQINDRNGLPVKREKLIKIQP